MEIALTPEQETRLVQMAQHEGKTPSQFVVDSVLSPGFDDYWESERIQEIVRQRLTDADHGVFIEEEEVDARVQRMLQV